MRVSARKKRADFTAGHEATVVYPHQLFQENPALAVDRPVILAEDPWFFKRFRFHAQKLVLHRASMRRYRDHLAARGFRVEYIEAADLDTSTDLIVQLARKGISEIHLCDPLETGLIEEIEKACSMQGVKLVTYESPMFLCTRDYLAEFYRGGRRFYLTEFYIAQRKRLGILLEQDGKPVGKRWTFDTLNRESLPKDFPIPPVWHPEPNEYVHEAISYVEEHFPGTYGNDTPFLWPVTFEDANRWFEDFLVNRLASFGRYEDAIHRNEPVLFHSALSPLLNIGLLTPENVVAATLAYAKEYEVSVGSLEGFIRQITGWREFMRGIYIIKGVEQRKSNFFEHTRAIPDSFYTGTTGIAPVDDSIKKLLNHAYTHHIERLMILGNFMLLSGFEPDGVYQWFMEMYIDSYDWVMVPNVYGMSQYADGGLITTKPYISGSNYILKMSNYTKGNWCPVWDGLYWSFIHRHFDTLKQNQRMNMVVNLLQKMDAEKLRGHLEVANRFIDS